MTSLRVGAETEAEQIRKVVSYALLSSHVDLRAVEDCLQCLYNYREDIYVCFSPTQFANLASRIDSRENVAVVAAEFRIW